MDQKSPLNLAHVFPQFYPESSSPRENESHQHLPPTLTSLPPPSRQHLGFPKSPNSRVLLFHEADLVSLEFASVCRGQFSQLARLNVLPWKLLVNRLLF